MRIGIDRIACKGAQNIIGSLPQKFFIDISGGLTYNDGVRGLNSWFFSGGPVDKFLGSCREFPPHIKNFCALPGGYLGDRWGIHFAIFLFNIIELGEVGE